MGYCRSLQWASHKEIDETSSRRIMSLVLLSRFGCTIICTVDLFACAHCSRAMAICLSEPFGIVCDSTAPMRWQKHQMLIVRAVPVTCQDLEASNAARACISQGEQVYTTVPGWPTNVEEELQPYFRRRTEITVEDGCL